MSAPINSTPVYARSGSTSSASSAGSNDNARRSSSFFKAVGHRIAEHHRDVTNAYEAYYGSFARPVNSASAHAPRRSQDSQEPLAVEAAQPKQSSTSKAWEKVKQHAKEHHASVNAAYRSYYGVS